MKPDLEGRSNFISAGRIVEHLFYKSMKQTISIWFVKKISDLFIVALFISLFAQSHVQNSPDCEYNKFHAGKETDLTLGAVWLIDYKLYILE